MSRGGKREGAGRKALPLTEKRRTLACRVEPKTIELIDNFVLQFGGNRGQAVDAIVQMCERLAGEE